VEDSDDTPVEFDQIDLDTHHAYDPGSHRYVVPVQGEYVAVAVVGYEGIETARGNCELWVQTAAMPGGVRLTAVTTPANASALGSRRLRVTCVVTGQFEAGDRVYAAAFQDSGGKLSLLTEAKSTTLQIFRIPSLAP
jgi:hypothetical protein